LVLVHDPERLYCRDGCPNGGLVVRIQSSVEVVVPGARGGRLLGGRGGWREWGCARAPCTGWDRVPGGGGGAGALPGATPCVGPGGEPDGPGRGPDVPGRVRGAAGGAAGGRA